MVEKFFNNTCSPDEAKQILEWFDTLEGRKYLKSKLDSDIDWLEDTHVQLSDSDLDSERIFKSIRERIRPEINFEYENRFYKFASLLRVAAVLLLVFGGSLFYFSHFYELPDQTADSDPIIYSTGDDQQKELTLSDGSKIRMNSNSQVRILGSFAEGTRMVELEGEAYFNVTHNPEKPFVINTGKASIQVLGTAFNVKSYASKGSVQVAVVEGRVALSSISLESSEDNSGEVDNPSVILTQGQFGYLDQDKVDIENFGVENYLVWMRGRLVFENLKLDKVCSQLTRLYNIQCEFRDESLKNLSLTTNISDDSLGKILSVISLSLDITYQMEEDRIVWINENNYDEINWQ